MCYHSGNDNKAGEGIDTNGERMTEAELTAAYQTYADMVYRIALVQTKSRSQAEDIQQDVFLALVRYSDRIQSEAHLKAWLIRVTQNACRKHFRSLWIRLTVLYDDSRLKDGALPEEAAEDPALEDGDDLALMKDMVEALPENMRAVIHLFYYEELSVRQIAATLGLTEQNVKTRLSRARDLLRKNLKEASP